MRLYSFIGLFLYIIVLSLSSVTADKKFRVPVLIWGSGFGAKENNFPTLKPVSTNDFLNHILKNIHKENTKGKVVVFVEETISNEDFISRTSRYETSFPSLQAISRTHDFEFLRSVENPVTALSSTDMKSYGFNTSEISLNDLEDTDLKDGVIYLVNLEDADSKEDRPEMLQRHDDTIANLYNKLFENNQNILVILTGRFSSWTEPEEVIRVRRQANETGNNEKPATPLKDDKISPSSGVVLYTKSALIYTKKPPVLKIGDKEITLESASGVSDVRDMYQRAVFTVTNPIGKITLRFKFENASYNMWSLSQVELESDIENCQLTTNRRISALFENSFHTSSPVVFKNKTTSLTFDGLQVQPWTTPLEDERPFGAAEDDTPFFTPPIWTGIIVTGIIALILSWALSMIMDIRTMDQFDDPKGKTITVNVVD